jgi:hypothetical protein
MFYWHCLFYHLQLTIRIIMLYISTSLNIGTPSRWLWAVSEMCRVLYIQKWVQLFVMNLLTCVRGNFRFRLFTSVSYCRKRIYIFRPSTKADRGGFVSTVQQETVLWMWKDDTGKEKQYMTIEWLPWLRVFRAATLTEGFPCCYPDWGFSVLLPLLRFFPAFSSVVRQMPGYNSQRRGTASTLPS